MTKSKESVKLMIVFEGNKEWAETIAKDSGFESVVTSHAEALQIFLDFEPTHVLIGDYDVESSEKHGKGFKTYKHIKNTAEDNVIVKVMGFMDHSENPDFLRLPFSLEELKKYFQL